MILLNKWKRFDIAPN